MADASPALPDLLSRDLPPGSHVLDLGCGDGTWLRALTDAGYRATGIDLSASFVAMARRRARGAFVHCGSAYRTPLPPVDAVTAIGEVLSYQPDAGRAPSFRAFSKRVFRALRPGGLFVFDVIVSGPPMAYE